MAREIVSNKNISNGYAGLDGSGLIASSQIPAAFLTTQSNQAVSAANGSSTFQTLSFANSNGVSFSTGTQGLYASHNGLTQQSTQPVAYSAANGSANFSTLTFANSNGVSFSTGTQGLFATVATTYAASNHSHGNPTLNLTNLSGTTASASNGLTLSLSGHPQINIATQVYDVASAGSTGTVTRYAPEDHRHAGVFRMAAGSNVGTTLGDTVAKHGEWVIAVSGNGTMSGSTGAGGVHTAWISIPNAAASPVGVSAGTTSSNLATINFADSNGVSFGLNGATVTASVNTSYAASNHSHGNPTLNLTNLSGTTASASNGFTLSLSAAAAGAENSVSTLIPYYPASTGTHTIAALNATSASAFIFPVSCEHNFVGNQLQLLEFYSYVTSNAAFTQAISRSLGIYTNNAGTLSLISSASFGLSVTGSSVSATLSYPASTGTGGYSYATTTATTTAQIHSLFGTVGNRVVGYQFANTFSLSEGLYWVGVMQRNTTTGAAGGLSVGLAGNVMAAAQNVAGIGLATSAQTTNPKFHFGWGVYTSTGSAGYGGTALPSSIFLSGIANTVTQMPMLTLISTT